MSESSHIIITILVSDAVCRVVVNLDMLFSPTIINTHENLLINKLSIFLLLYSDETDLVKLRRRKFSSIQPTHYCFIENKVVIPWLELFETAVFVSP